MSEDMPDRNRGRNLHYRKEGLVQSTNWIFQGVFVEKHAPSFISFCNVRTSIEIHFELWNSLYHFVGLLLSNTNFTYIDFTYHFVDVSLQTCLTTKCIFFKRET